MGELIEQAPAFVAQGVHRDAIVYHPRVVTMLVASGTSATSAVVDSLILMRVWKWNWVRDSTGEYRRFALDEAELPWARLTYEDLAEQVGVSVGRARDAVRRLEQSGHLLTRIMGHPEHGSQKFYLVNWTTADPQHPEVRIPNTPPADPQHPYRGNTEDTNVDSVQSLSSGRSLVPAKGDGNDEEIGRLCRLLATAVEQQRGSRPRVTTNWMKDIDLLLRRGPKGVDGPPPSVQEVEQMIAGVFSKLSEPDRKGFCWADQIRSAHALRDHWDQLRVALQRSNRNQPKVSDDQMADAVRQMKDYGL
jgi:hypothetical protein